LAFRSSIRAVPRAGARAFAAATSRKAFVEHDPTSDFPLQNLPFGVFSGSDGKGPRCATAIGNKAVDLAALAGAGAFKGLPFDAAAVFQKPALNDFMALPQSAWLSTRARLTELLASDGDALLRSDAALCSTVLRPLAEVAMHMPASVGDYTDCYASREHATNVGIMFRGIDNALQPNWLHLPVAYHGRASSVVVSGTPITRPRGQKQKDKADASQGSIYGDSNLMDYELEIGAFVGGPCPPLGVPIDIKEAHKHIFGFVILNDWSARDIQPWEYVPLGPFTAKNLGSTISPWIVTPAALEPFTCPTSAGKQDDPVPLEYLQDPNYSSYNLQLFADLETPDGVTTTIAETNFQHMYWTPRQQLAHHTVTGCNMRPGDLIGSGTISGTIGNSEGKSKNYGSLLEQSWRGTQKISLNDGSERTFVRDGDTINMRGFCQGEGYRVGFGDCAGKILPAGSQPK